MLFADSRYARISARFVRDSKGERKRIVHPPSFYPTSFVAQEHVVRQGDRLDRLAHQYYGDPDKWWSIAAANPEVFYPEDLPPGSIIRIPDVPSVR